jgi:vacuolar-type H+-ATPase subunit E/Vma4
MALEHILAAIRQEGEADLAALEAACDEEVRRLQSQAEAESAALVEAAITADAVRTTLAVRRIEGQAEAQAQRVLGDAREQVFQEALALVRERLGALRQDPRWPAVLEALLREAHAALPDATLLHLDLRDVHLLKRADRALGRIPDLDGWGGVVLETDDGRAVDNTLEARLDTAMPELRRVILAHIPSLRRAS